MSNICIIPARGNSTRIPGKNIKLFHGRPMIEYALDLAFDSHLFDKVYVTTDSKKIADVVNSYINVASHYDRKPELGIIDRPVELAKNEATTLEVVGHALESINAGYEDMTCVIYPCSPMLKKLDITSGMARLSEHKPHGTASLAFSVGLDPLRDAGNFYLSHAGRFMNDKYGAPLPIHGMFSIMIPIPKERCIDINTMDDWKKAEQMFLGLKDKSLTATEIVRRNKEMNEWGKQNKEDIMNRLNYD